MVLPLLQRKQRLGLRAVDVRHVVRVPRELGVHGRRGNEGREVVLRVQRVHAAGCAKEPLVSRLAPVDVVVEELAVRLVGVFVQAYGGGAGDVLQERRYYGKREFRNKGLKHSYVSCEFDIIRRYSIQFNKIRDTSIAHVLQCIPLERGRRMTPLVNIMVHSTTI